MYGSIRGACSGRPSVPRVDGPVLDGPYDPVLVGLWRRLNGRVRAQDGDGQYEEADPGQYPRHTHHDREHDAEIMQVSNYPASFATTPPCEDLPSRRSVKPRSKGRQP
jgi:hypothetical protein